MGIQAIKGVEVGDGFDVARKRGSQVMDEIVRGEDGLTRTSGRLGGTEGGMSSGEVLRVRAAMKPISTVPRALRTIDTATGEEALAHHQRSDVCAVPPPASVAEAMVALVLADVASRSSAATRSTRPGATARPTSRGSRSDEPLLVLVGPPGAGKSTVGRLAAELLDVGFRDTDLDIVRAVGQADQRGRSSTTARSTSAS
jgi:Mrp family chromosome partitioning ATPase